MTCEINCTDNQQTCPNGYHWPSAICHCDCHVKKKRALKKNNLLSVRLAGDTQFILVDASSVNLESLFISQNVFQGHRDAWQVIEKRLQEYGHSVNVSLVLQGDRFSAKVF